MKFLYNMESLLVIIITVLCTILFLNLVYILRLVLKYPVNCWFCSSNFWVKFVDRNCWTCPKCEQYNGFTKDGDYNKVIFNGNEPRTFHMSNGFTKMSPKNGLCKMCNVNQQLKVVQLANFVPINEKKFDEEIENYKNQLEKAYRLCARCRKVLQLKLYKEKEALLGSKRLENRSPEKTSKSKPTGTTVMKTVVNSTSMMIAAVLMLMIIVESYTHVKQNKDLFITLTSIKNIITGFIERIINIVKMKLLLTFPILEKYFYSISDVINLSILPNVFYECVKKLEYMNHMTQKSLCGIVCVIQIIGNIFKVNRTQHTVFIDIMWLFFTTICITADTVPVSPTQISFIKIMNIVTLLLVYKYMNNSADNKIRKTRTPTKVRNMTGGRVTSPMFDDEDTALETDDDVSLSKFGLHNFTDSSNETVSPLNSTKASRRYFNPHTNNSSWFNGKLNSTFCVNTMLTNSPNSMSETGFSKPSFPKYEQLIKDDFGSELDESISCLSIGSPKKVEQKSNPMFSLRKFTASPNFVVPTPLNRSRPLISPSKLGHGTSWVAGGYWGSDGERQVFNVDGSRSSSQSSGFESQASSMTQRNVLSQPPSREESVFGEVDKTSMLDRFQPFKSLAHPQQTPNHINSPVFPQMQYNNHVHIPQPKFTTQSAVSQSIFNQQRQYIPNNGFKTPHGILNLGQGNSFSTR